MKMVNMTNSAEQLAGSAYSANLGFRDAGQYRSTPQGQKTVPEIITVGMKIRSSYGTGGIVAMVRGPFLYTANDGKEYSHYTLVYVPPKIWGKHKSSDHHWINELVAVDGRILKLFEANSDEVFSENATLIVAADRRGQLSLF